MTIYDFEPSIWVSKEVFGKIKKMHADIFFFVFSANSLVFLKMAAMAEID